MTNKNRVSSPRWTTVETITDDTKVNVGDTTVTAKPDTVFNGERVGNVTQITEVIGTEEVVVTPEHETDVTSGVEVRLLGNKSKEKTRKQKIKEFMARFFAGTALVTLASGIASTSSDKAEHIADNMVSHSMEFGGTPAGVGTSTIQVEGEIAPEVTQGPSGKLPAPGENDPNFEAPPLSSDVRSSIEAFVADVVDQQSTVVETAKSSGMTEDEIAENNIGAVQIETHGMSSDEAGPGAGLDGRRNIGEPSPDNEKMAKEYGQVVADEVARLLAEQGVDNVELIPVTGEEKILEQSQIDELDMIAEKYEASLSEVIGSYNYGEGDIELDEDDTKILDELLAQNRGAELSSTIVSAEKAEVGPCDKVVAIETREYEIPGKDPIKLEFILLPGYLPAIRIRKKKKTVPAEMGTKVIKSVHYEGTVKDEDGKVIKPEDEDEGGTPGPIPGPNPGPNPGPTPPIRYDKERYDKKHKKWSKAKWLVLPVGALMFALPTGFSTEDGNSTTQPQGECVMITENEGDVISIDLESMVAKYVGPYVDIDNYEGVVTINNPGSTTQVRQEYTIHQVDENGNVIETVAVPAEAKRTFDGIFPDIDVSAK